MRKPLYCIPERDEHFANFLALLSDQNPIKRRARKCGSLDHWAGNTFYCRLFCCPRCRYLEQNKQVRKLTRLYAQADRSRMFMITICFAVVASLDNIDELWAAEKKRFNYLFARQRRRSRRWASAHLNVFLEIMPFTEDEVTLVGDEHAEMLASMGMPRPLFEGGPLWLVHIHGVGHARDLDWQEVRDALVERWPHANQVKVEPLYEWRERDQSLEAIVRYSLKYAPGRMIANARRDWPMSWMSELYEWAFGFSRSYQSFKFSIGSKAVRSASDILRDVGARVRDEFSISHIPLTEPPTGLGGEVELPIDYSDPTSDDVRSELTDWCRDHCEHPYTKHWLVADEIARFRFDSDVEAVAFKLRFSDLLSGDT